MTTKAQMITLLKEENPTLRVGNEENGYTELSSAEYDAVISEWADARLLKEQIKAEEQAKAAQKQALLDRLGITQEEAQLLLGGN